MERIVEQPQDANSSKGGFKVAGKVLKNIIQDARIRRSFKKIGENNATITSMGRGVSTEVLRKPEVREAAKNVGRTALISSGVVDYEPEANKMTPNLKGIVGAILLPEVAIAKAIQGAKEELPNLARETANATPNAVKEYGAANPGTFKEAGQAALSNVREAIVLPFHVGRAAIQGLVEAYPPQDIMNDGSIHAASVSV